jgi:hypothetical protein
MFQNPDGTASALVYAFMMEYKVELMRLGKRQVDVIKALATKGIYTDASDLSLALNGLPRPKFDLLRTETEKIIEEWKKA